MYEMLSNREAAELYRLQQARELLLGLGFVELPDGSFRAPEDLENFRPGGPQPGGNFVHPLMEDAPES